MPEGGIRVFWKGFRTGWACRPVFLATHDSRDRKIKNLYPSEKGIFTYKISAFKGRNFLLGCDLCFLEHFFMCKKRRGLMLS